MSAFFPSPLCDIHRLSCALSPKCALDEYISTVASQQKFQTLSTQDLQTGFTKTYPMFHVKFVAKTLTVFDIASFLYWCSHLFAFADIMTTPVEILEIKTYMNEVETNLADFIEKRFFINLRQEVNNFVSQKDLGLAAHKMNIILDQFYRLAHRSPHK